MKRASRAKPSQKEAYLGALLRVLSGFLSDPERYLHHLLRVGASEA